MNQQEPTLGELIIHCTATLKARFPDLSLHHEAKWLVAKALDLSPNRLLSQTNIQVTQSDQAQVQRMLDARLTGMPLAYVLGEWDFWDLCLKVGAGVLVPRQDTEILVQAALEMTKNLGKILVAEVGCGSGAIALAFGTSRANTIILATELETQALDYARANIRHYSPRLQSQGSKVLAVQGWGLRPLVNNRFDMILSNPPYIPNKDIQTLMPEVRDFEPAQALDGGRDGLDFYRYFHEAGFASLKSQGILLIEHGFDQREAIEAIFAQGQWKRCTAFKDLSGHDRVLAFAKP